MSVALFMLVVTLVGGNMPLAVPAVSAAYAQYYQNDVRVQFDAANEYSSSAVAGIIVLQQKSQ